MIVFLLLLLLVGILVYYWQKEPILVEKFVSSNSSNFDSIIPTVDVFGQPMNGPIYMFYALTSNYILGQNAASTAGIPVDYNYSQNIYMNTFKSMTDIQLRVATEKERQYFLRNGGINREGTTYTLTRESGGNGAFPSLINTAKLVVSTKPPNKQWNQTPSSQIIFATNESNITIESLIEGTIFRSIVRYPFNEKQQVFEINVDDYKQSISDCLFIGKTLSQTLASTGIRAYELNPAAPLNDNIGTGAFISYEDTNLNNAGAAVAAAGAPGSSSSNTARGSSSSNAQSTTNTASYSGVISGQTASNISQKLALLDAKFNEESTFVDANNTKLTWRKALQQKCGATIFNRLRFEGTPDPESCKLASNTLSNYFIKFNDYSNLLECSLITSPLQNAIASLKEQPVKPSTGFANAQPDSSGVILKMNGLKLGNEYTYELQLNDESNTEDNSSKYIFSPFRFTAGKQNQTSADITTLNIIINENSDKIDIISVKNNTKTLLGQIDKPATFKLYSSIRLQAIIYAFPNKSMTNSTKLYSFTHIEQDTSSNSRYELYKSDIYDNTTKSTIIDFMYINANTIQATFTINNKSSIIPAGNYTFVFEDAATGSFIDAANANLNSKQFTRIQINVLSGDIDFYNNTTKTMTIKSTFKEQAAPVNFKLALNDPSNRLTYFAGSYQAFGNRYDGIQKITTINFGSSSSSNASTQQAQQAQQAQVQKDDKEVVYIETPVNDGIDPDTAIKVAQNLGMQIATIDQVVQAMKDNANWCSPGWCEFTDINGKKVLRAAYPLTSQITDSKCITQDDSIALYNKGVVVVSTPTTLKSQLMIYKKKEDIPSNLTENNQIFKQSYFNAMIGLWKRDSNTAINDNEIFAITKQDGAIASNDIAKLVNNLQHCTIATEQQIERQLEYIKGKNIPLPNIMEVGWALDSKNIPIKIMLNGKLTKLPASTSFVNSVYCYGNKANSNGRLDNNGKFIKSNNTDSNNTDSNNTDNNTYKIQAYNAELNIANQNDKINYKPLIFKTKPLIDQVKKYNAKGALILKEVRDTPSGVVREGFTSSSSYKDIYAGCDVNSYGCITLSGSGEKLAPPPLVSKNGKFQILKMETLNGNVFENPTSIAQGIQNARDCQAAGGDIAITDDTYPGCPAGYCCEPVEDNTLLDTSMFAETCDDSNTANAVDKCDDTEEVLPLHQQAFEPYKLTRVQRTKTPTTAKCSKPKLSKSLKETFQNTPEYMRDVHQITKNERMFSLKFNRGY